MAAAENKGIFLTSVGEFLNCQCLTGCLCSCWCLQRSAAAGHRLGLQPELHTGHPGEKGDTPWAKKPDGCLKNPCKLPSSPKPSFHLSLPSHDSTVLLADLGFCANQGKSVGLSVFVVPAYFSWKDLLGICNVKRNVRVCLNLGCTN